MKPMILSQFLGISPKQSPYLQAGWAETAQNCDLSDGKLGPWPDDLLIQADANGYNSMCWFGGTWQVGNDRHFLVWKIGDHELLIFLDAGVPMKTVAGVTAPLGQTRLSAPSAADIGAGGINTTVQYIITTTRSVGGYTDESGPSDASAELALANRQARVTRPAITDPLVTHWNIYRLDTNASAYQLVATLDVTETTYDDNTASGDLGASPTTWYTSDQGNSIFFDEPSTTFDGICNEPLAGILFFWKGSTLHWSEPGYPDAFVGFYTMNFPSDIKRVICHAGLVTVLTATGVHRVDGTHPELLQPSKAMGNHSCLGTAACATDQGIVYRTDSGLALFNTAVVSVFTDAAFDEDWFREAVDVAGATLIESDRFLFLFHSRGTLVLDARSQPGHWFTLDLLATAAWVRPDTGALYLMDASGVRELFGGTGYRTWTWRSGELPPGGGPEKDFSDVEVFGVGTVGLTLIVDGEEVAGKSLTLAGLARHRTLKFPEQTRGRAMQVEMTGTGVVKEMVLR